MMVLFYLTVHPEVAYESEAMVRGPEETWDPPVCVLRVNRVD